MLNKEELKEMLSNFTKEEIALNYNISQSTLSRLLKKHNLTKEGYGANKLNFEKADEIRAFYKNNKTQKELSEMFGVSQPTIHKVVNNLIYKTNSSKLSGEADVKVNYKY